MRDLAIGIDVSQNRGLDVVAMWSDRTIEFARARVGPCELEDVLEEWKPAVVAIDSPPGHGCEPGASTRACERELRALGVNIFSTPSDTDRLSRPFYGWIMVGIETFEAAARARYPRQRQPNEVRGRAIEVFPHASDVFLRGHLPPVGTLRRRGRKRDWRLETLRRAGCTVDNLARNRVGRPTIDSVDAALAALTGVYALEGDYSAYGAGCEWLVVPGQTTSRFIVGPLGTSPF